MKCSHLLTLLSPCGQPHPVAAKSTMESCSKSHGEKFSMGGEGTGGVIGGREEELGSEIPLAASAGVLWGALSGTAEALKAEVIP